MNVVIVAQDEVPAGFWVFMIVLLAIGIGGFVFWIWALVDAVRVPDDRYYQSGTKLVWVLVIALLQVIGAIVYLVAGRPTKAVRDALRSGGASPSGMPPPPPPPAGTV